MDYQAIENLTKLVKAYQLSALEIEENGARIRLENQNSGTALSSDYPVPDIARNMDSSSFFGEKIEPEIKTQSGEDENCYYITAPMVGVFCSLEKLGKASLNPGDRIPVGTVVCAIEAMKLICDVKTEGSGTFVACLAQDDEMVEFGQPLIKLLKD